jgi:hypothetical protein
MEIPAHRGVSILPSQICRRHDPIPEGERHCRKIAGSMMMTQIAAVMTGQSGSYPRQEKSGIRLKQFNVHRANRKSPPVKRNQRAVFRRTKATAAGNIEKPKYAPKAPRNFVTSMVVMIFS